MYWNYFTWCSIGVRMEGDEAERRRIVRFTDPDGGVVDVPLLSSIGGNNSSSSTSSGGGGGGDDDDDDEEGDSILHIRAEPLSYRLGFQHVPSSTPSSSSSSSDHQTTATKSDSDFGIESNTIHWIGEVSIDTMTRDPPVGASFTGMMFGLYAFGEREPCLEPADFRWAEFRGEEG